MTINVTKTIPVELNAESSYAVRIRSLNPFGVPSAWSESIVIDTTAAGLASAGRLVITNDGMVAYDNKGQISFNYSSVPAIRTNLVTNPSFEVGVTGWEALSNTSISRTTSDFFVGVTGALACMQVQATANSANVGAAITLSRQATITAGLPYTTTAFIKVPTGQSAEDFKLGIRFYDGSNNFVSEVVSINATNIKPGDNWVRLSNVGITAPSGSSRARVVVYTSSVMNSGQYYYVDGVLLEQTSVLREYFDGSSSTGTAQWTGTAHDSSSTLDTTGIYSLNGGVLTESTFQTSRTVSTTGGVIMNTTGIKGYNSAGVQKFSLNAVTGLLTAVDATIEGSITADAFILTENGNTVLDFDAPGASYGLNFRHGGTTFSQSVINWTYDPVASSQGIAFKGPRRFSTTAAGGQGEILFTYGTNNSDIGIDTGYQSTTANTGPISAIRLSANTAGTKYITLETRTTNTVVSNMYIDSTLAFLQLNNSSGTVLGSHYIDTSAIRSMKYSGGALVGEFYADVNTTSINKYSGGNTIGSIYIDATLSSMKRYSSGFVTSDISMDNGAIRMEKWQSGTSKGYFYLDNGQAIIQSDGNISYIADGGTHIFNNTISVPTVSATTLTASGNVSGNGVYGNILVSNGGVLATGAGNGFSWTGDGGYDSGMFWISDGYFTFKSNNVDKFSIHPTTGLSAVLGGGTGTTVVISGVPGGALLYNTSRRIFKENIQELTNESSLLDQLVPVSFTWKVKEDEIGTDIENWKKWDTNYGFIVDDVAEIDPHLVTWMEEEGELEPVMWRETHMIALLVKEVQMLKARIIQLES